MTKTINESLHEMKGQLLYYSKLLEKLSKIEKEIIRTKHQLMALSDIWDNEESDVKELNSFSLTTLFLKLSGKYDKKISEENRELLEAKANFEKCNNYLMTLLEEKKQLSEEASSYYTLEQDYNKLLSEKEASLYASDNPSKEKLVAISGEINKLNLELKEINEAIDQGSELYSVLRSLTSELEDAESVLRETNLNKVTSQLKIENISDYINQVKLQLSKYKVELSDLDDALQSTINLNELDSLCDSLFDNFFADLMVEAPIKDALQDVKALRTAIENIQSSLRDDKKSLLENISKLKAEKDTILEES